MRMLFIRCSVLVFVACAISGLSQVAATPRINDHTTREQRIVTDAYNKVAYLTELDAYSKTVLNSVSGEQIDPATVGRRLSNSVVSYKLDDFRTGDISEIADTKWGDMVSFPSAADHTVITPLRLQSWKDNDLSIVSWTTAEASLGKPVEISEAVRNVVQAMTVRSILALGGRLMTDPDVIYSRYTSYKVTVQFQGRTIGPYKALFFFGKNAEGYEYASPQDLYADGSSLYRATRESFYPSGLLHTRFRDVPILAQWLAGTAMEPQSCSDGAGSLCCTATRCVVSSTDLQHDIALPLGAPKQ